MQSFFMCAGSLLDPNKPKNARPPVVVTVAGKHPTDNFDKIHPLTKIARKMWSLEIEKHKDFDQDPNPKTIGLACFCWQEKGSGSLQLPGNITNLLEIKGNFQRRNLLPKGFRYILKNPGFPQSNPIPDAPWDGNIYQAISPCSMWLFLTFHVGKYSRPMEHLLGGSSQLVSG